MYIDKENIISLVNSKAQPNYENCERLIRNNMDVYCNFSKDEIKSDECLNAWFRCYAQGVQGKITFCPPNVIIPDRPLKSNSFTQSTSEKLSSIYLLNEDHKCDVIADKSCVLVGKVGQEISVIEKLIIENTEELCMNIRWDNYLINLPLTDIIICDNHYFKDKHVYNDNNNIIIRTLSGIPINSQVNVVIITNEGNIDAGLDLSAECTTIKTIVKTLSQHTKSSVTILTTRKTHDRHIICNYYRVKCGSCLHLINNGVKCDVTAEIKSHAIRQNYRITCDLLSAFQNIADAPVNCYGDRNSNYLNFK